MDITHPKRYASELLNLSQFTIQKVKVKKVKIDDAFGIWRCINGTYSLSDNDKQIYFNICW